VNSNGTDIQDFETRLRGELRRRADQLVLDHAPPGFPPPIRRRRGPILGGVVAVAVVVIVLAAALVTNHLASTSGTHLRTQSGASGQLGQGSPLHLTITLPGVPLRAAQNLPDAATSPTSDATFASLTYRMPGELRPPIVYATLSRTSDQAFPSDPQHHPLYHAINVAGRSGEIVWLGSDVADLVVRVDDAHLLDLSSWGLTQAELVNAASSVVVRSDTAFELPGLPAGLLAADAAPSSVRGGSRAEFSSNDESALLYVYSGGLESRIGAFLYPGSGTQLGSTTIEQVSVNGTPALLRIDRLESPNASAGVQPLSFLAVWEQGSDQTVEVTGGAQSRTAISDTLDAVAPVDDKTWQDMVARCPWPTRVGTDTTNQC
jgi:hypothetical protein